RQSELAKQPRLDQQPQGPIDRRPADSVAGVVQVADQLVRVEVFMGIEDMSNEEASRAGQLLAPNLEEFAELLLGRLGDRQRRQFVSSTLCHKNIPRTRHRLWATKTETTPSRMILHSSVPRDVLPGGASPDGVDP